MRFIIASILSLILLWYPDFDPGTFFMPEEIDLMARVVMSEASTQPFEAKQAVAATLLNRYRSDLYSNDISEIIKGQYSTQNNGTPTEECYDAVYAAIAWPNAFPEDMFYFRDSHYHTFGYPWNKFGNLYFSTKYEQIGYIEGEIENYD